MGGVVQKLVFRSGKDKLGTTYSSLWDIPAVDIDGNTVERIGSLVHGKKAVLVVNVASK